MLKFDALNDDPRTTVRRGVSWDTVIGFGLRSSDPAEAMEQAGLTVGTILLENAWPLDIEAVLETVGTLADTEPPIPDEYRPSFMLGAASAVGLVETGQLRLEVA